MLSVVVACCCILKIYSEVAAEELPHNNSIVPVDRVAKKNLQGSYSNLDLSDKLPLPSNRCFIGTTSYVRVSEEASFFHLEYPELFLYEPSFDGKVLCNQTFANIEANWTGMLSDYSLKRPFHSRSSAFFDLLQQDILNVTVSHLLSGRFKRMRTKRDWLHFPQEAYLNWIKKSSADSNIKKDSLQRISLPFANYNRLKQALIRYQTIAKNGGWPTVPPGSSLKKGDHDERVGILRALLITMGDLDYFAKSNSDLLDNMLEQAVRKFQERHGLEVDGIVGPITLAALNVPVSERIKKIRINMARWRQLPYDLGQRYILVNTANCELNVVEGGRTIIKMRTVVGRPDRPTPAFSEKITYLVFNPYWHIPSRIAREDILPKIQMNSDYPLDQNIKVFDVIKDQMVELDPRSVNWTAVTSETFDFKLRQEPGPLNALGRVKFMFPNRFNVYIHDSPVRGLFEKTKRNFSSGCIRTEDPLNLAEYLLREEGKWDRAKILATIDSGRRRIVRLSQPIAVYILYFTAWVEHNETIHFRDDIYKRDKKLAKCLFE